MTGRGLYDVIRLDPARISEEMPGTLCLDVLTALIPRVLDNAMCSLGSDVLHDLLPANSARMVTRAWKTTL